MAKVLLLVIVGLTAILHWGDSVWLFLRRKMILRSFKKDMRAVGEAIWVHPPTTPGSLAKQFLLDAENYEGGDPELQARALHYRIMRAVLAGKNPRKKDVKRFRDFGKLKAVDQEGLAMYPDAVYEMDGVVLGRVFFRKNLTLAGYRNYESDVEKILIGVLERKHLLPGDAELFRRIHVLFPATEWDKWKGQYYGSSGFPYPDERYHVREKVRGKLMGFYFNENFDLVVVTKDRENREEDEPFYEVVWELPGARRPELYQ